MKYIIYILLFWSINCSAQSILQFISKAKKSTDSTTYILSNYGVTNVADLSMESTTFGTDQTSKIQNILDRAQLHPIKIIWDVKCAITQIRIRSNTKIIANAGCGAIQITGTNNMMIVNYHKIDTANSMTSWPRLDHDISIEGGIWNQNAQVSGVQHQTHATPSSGWNMVFRFAGVTNLTLSNLTVRNSRAYNIYINNYNNILVHDIYIELPTTPVSVGNYDGCKIGGPGTYANIYNISGMFWDDIVSLCPNDGLFPDRVHQLDSTQFSETVNGKVYKLPFYDAAATHGNMYNSTVSNISWIGTNNKNQLRLLSTSDTLFNTTIDGLHGSTHNNILVATTWPNCFGGSGGGFFKNLTIKHVDAKLQYGYNDFYCNIYFGAKFWNLRVEDCVRTDMSVNYPYFMFSQNSMVDSAYFKNITCNPLTNVNSTLISLNSFIFNKLTLDSVNYNHTFTQGNSVVLYLDYNNNLQNLLIKNSYTVNLQNYFYGAFNNGVTFKANNVRFNGSNVTAFYNTSTAAGPNSTILTNITGATTLLSGYFGGQVITDLYKPKQYHFLAYKR